MARGLFRWKKSLLHHQDNYRRAAGLKSVDAIAPRHAPTPAMTSNIGKIPVGMNEIEVELGLKCSTARNAAADESAAVAEE